LGAAQAARASLNGVSVDEEMVDLVKFQHSYEAAARVISVADGMLDKLIEMVR
jgi:flagellar hook-associated protein 1 FlgK